MSHDIVRIPVPGTSSALDATLIDGNPFVALKPMCEAIGIAYPTQLDKLKSRSWAVITQRGTTGSDGKTYQMNMVDRRTMTMTMWLATLDENRVSEAARSTVIAFQNEAADALDSYFHDGIAVRPDLSTLDGIRALCDQLEAAERQAAEAKQIASRTDARLDAIEGRHDWYAALGYARLIGFSDTSSQTLAKIGYMATQIARTSEPPVIANKVTHALFGRVNSYPAWVWELAFTDYQAAV